MSAFLRQLFDTIFPPRDDTLLVRQLTKDDMHRLFHVTYGDIISLSFYSDIHVRALIHEAKFYHNSDACVLLHTFIHEYLKHTPQSFDFCIPVPLSSKRLIERGYNQVTEMLKSQALPFPIYENILIRKKHTRPQTELARTERLVNVTGAFEVRNHDRIKNKHILLVDDVTTTGTTLQTAKAALLPYSPTSITCVALAH